MVHVRTKPSALGATQGTTRGPTEVVSSRWPLHGFEDEAYKANTLHCTNARNHGQRERVAKDLLRKIRNQ